MKIKLAPITICYLLSAIFELAFAQGAAFTCQGRLNNDANPANGSGASSFTEINALLFAMRFYRVLSP